MPFRALHCWLDQLCWEVASARIISEVGGCVAAQVSTVIAPKMSLFAYKIIRWSSDDMYKISQIIDLKGIHAKLTLLFDAPFLIFNHNLIALETFLHNPKSYNFQAFGKTIANSLPYLDQTLNIRICTSHHRNLSLWFLIKNYSSWSPFDRVFYYHLLELFLACVYLVYFRERFAVGIEGMEEVDYLVEIQLRSQGVWFHEDCYYWLFLSGEVVKCLRSIYCWNEGVVQTTQLHLKARCVFVCVYAF